MPLTQTIPPMLRAQHALALPFAASTAPEQCSRYDLQPPFICRRCYRFDEASRFVALAAECHCEECVHHKRWKGKLEQLWFEMHDIKLHEEEAPQVLLVEGRVHSPFMLFRRLIQTTT